MTLPDPQEPSVLDYVKARLNPWQKQKIQIPEPAPSPEEPDSNPAYHSFPRLDWNLSGWARLPWRTALALALALYAQLLLEPETRAIFPALALYAAALLLMLWAFFLGEFQLPAVPKAQPQTDPQTFGRFSFLLGIALAVVAFPLFAKNLFDGFNLTLWLGAIALLLFSFWRSDSDPARLTRWASWFSREHWHIRISRHSLLLLLLAGLILFFRFYQLESVPAEPFSDHAEKLWDVYDLLHGKPYVFFERNTGREFLQFYITAAVAAIFQTGLSFLSLKLGTVLIGLFALPYIYLLGREGGGARVALLALFLAGTAYWLNTISRIGLRFPLYPALAAPVIYHTLRGLRSQNRNDFLLAGIFLGLGMHGYSPFRLVPLAVMLAVSLYLLHPAAQGKRKQTVVLFGLLVLVSFVVFLPLFAYSLGHWEMFLFRGLSRLGETEQAFAAPPWQIFLENNYRAMLMFNWDDGEIWVHSVTHRPALDVVSAVLFALGYVFVLVRYLQKRGWLDAFLLLAIPVLLLPSTLSLAFPGENPSLNRTGAAGVVVFVIAAMALDGLYNAFRGVSSGRGRRLGALILLGGLLSVSAFQNYDLVFHQFAAQFRAGAWNTSDMGRVIRGFVMMGNPVENAWVVPYPHWVDTRLVGIQSGFVMRDAALFTGSLGESLSVPGNKLFIVKHDDAVSLQTLQDLYPAGTWVLFDSDLEGKDFYIFSVLSPAPAP